MREFQLHVFPYTVLLCLEGQKMQDFQCKNTTMFIHERKKSTHGLSFTDLDLLLN